MVGRARCRSESPRHRADQPHRQPPGRPGSARRHLRAAVADHRLLPTPSAPEDEEKSPGDRAIEHRLRSIIRWNAMAIILRANKESSELGGHIASFQSAATLYDIGFGHFWHAANDAHGGDLIYFQGHSSPGHLCARVHGRPAHRTAAAGLSAGGRRQRHPVLPAPLADAGLLAVPDRLDGPRPADGDLPGALPEVPAGPRPGRHRAAQGLGLHGRRRDGRARIARRDLARRPRAPRQPDLRHQLQPAAPRRPGARQRQDHPGTRSRCSAAPAGT